MDARMAGGILLSVAALGDTGRLDRERVVETTADGEDVTIYLPAGATAYTDRRVYVWARDARYRVAFDADGWPSDLEATD